ncbi:hypothetical protein V2J09_001284 [Rumex salicifolius]
MSTATKGQFTMKLIIDKKSNKVVYAEATKDLVDFLLKVFVTPLGSTVKQLFSGGTVGCIANLHKSVADDLSVDYMEFTSETKAYLQDPKSVKNFYKCSKLASFFCNKYVSDHNSVKCPACGNKLDSKLSYVDSCGVGFVKGQVTYMITDDLTVKPLSTASTIAILNQLNVKDVGCIHETQVTLDSDKGMELLKASLMSNTALTHTFLVKKEI